MFLLQVEGSNGNWVTVERSPKRHMLLGARGARLARNPGANVRIVTAPRRNPLGDLIARLWLEGESLRKIEREISAYYKARKAGVK